MPASPRVWVALARRAGALLRAEAEALVNTCDDALLDDDPASAGRAIEQARERGRRLEHLGELLLAGEAETLTQLLEGVELPAVPEAEEPAPVATPRWRKAVVAEDDAAMRELEVTILAPMFITVVEASDGPAALAALDAEVDLLLLDLRMPGRNGVEVIREALQVYPNLRIIVVSGAMADGTSGAAIEAGARAAVVKPFQIAELRALIKGVLADAGW